MRTSTSDSPCYYLLRQVQIKECSSNDVGSLPCNIVATQGVAPHQLVTMHCLPSRRHQPPCAGCVASPHEQLASVSSSPCLLCHAVSFCELLFRVTTSRKVSHSGVITKCGLSLACCQSTLPRHTFRNSISMLPVLSLSAASITICMLVLMPLPLALQFTHTRISSYGRDEEETEYLVPQAGENLSGV